MPTNILLQVFIKQLMIITDDFIHDNFGHGYLKVKN
jgi:hypothetical protein